MSKPSSFLISDLISNTSQSHSNKLMINLKCMKNSLKEGYHSEDFANALSLFDWSIIPSLQQNKLDINQRPSIYHSNENSGN